MMVAPGTHPPTPITARSNSVTERDVIVMGAGHNGLAAAATLAKRGLDVLVLEKNDYCGGMMGTRTLRALLCFAAISTLSSPSFWRRPRAS